MSFAQNILTVMLFCCDYAKCRKLVSLVGVATGKCFVLIVWYTKKKIFRLQLICMAACMEADPYCYFCLPYMPLC